MINVPSSVRVAGTRTLIAAHRSNKAYSIKITGMNATCARAIRPALKKARVSAVPPKADICSALALAIPRHELSVGTKHRDAVTHVVESNAQLGLPLT